MIRAAKLALLGIAGALAFSAFGAAPATAASGGAAAPANITVGSGGPVTPQRDGCVQTDVGRSGQIVYWVRITNACNFTLYATDSHAFNGPAGVDSRSGRQDMGPGAYFQYNYGGWYAPPGSLTCGELWGPNARLWGRDCRTM